jgi:hypothetical protein
MAAAHCPAHADALVQRVDADFELTTTPAD